MSLTAILCGIIVDSSVVCGLELIGLEDDAVHIVGEFICGVSYAVNNNVAHGKLAEEALVSGLCPDNTRPQFR